VRTRNRLLNVTLSAVALMTAAQVAAPNASAVPYDGQPCNDLDLIATVSPLLVCGGEGSLTWTRAADPAYSSRQTLGAPCSVNPQGGTTAIANDPASGSAYYAMCSGGAWVRFRV
jgi:hypothetical protein